MVNYDQACQAVLPERYPADEQGLRLDLADNEVSELDPEFWDQTAQYVERRLLRLLRTAGQGEAPLNHLSIFALAPIPALIDFGKRVGDIISADVYQRQRRTGDWRWQDLDDVGFDFQIDRPAPDRRSGSRVALNLSLSDVIHSAAIERAMGGPCPTYKLTIGRPRRDFLRAKEQLELFRNEWYALLSEIREAHREDCEIHVFPAVPSSVAVEIGRSLLPKSDPQLVVYDFNKGCGGFQRAIAV